MLSLLLGVIRDPALNAMLLLIANWPSTIRAIVLNGGPIFLLLAAVAIFLALIIPSNNLRA
jgi:hypothetical protein